MRVHHLDCGSATLPAAWAAGRLPGFAHRPPLVCHVLLVEAFDALVLVDTGPDARVADEVRALGFDTRDVRHIVLTTLRPEHAGGLAQFPEAQVHVLEAEHRDALRTHRARLAPTRYRPAHWAHRPAWRLHEADRLGGDRWFGFECAREVCGDGDVVLLPLAGPTAGHAGVAVRTGDGWLLDAGDAYLLRDEIHGSAPRCPVTLRLARHLADSNPAARADNQDRLRVLASDPDAGVLVFSSHDRTELELCAERNPPRRREDRESADGVELLRVEEELPAPGEAAPEAATQAAEQSADRGDVAVQVVELLPRRR